MPFIFFAKNDSNKDVGKNFKDAWDNSVAGPRTIRLYLPNILGLIQTYLDSNKWNLKHSAARANSDMVEAFIKSGEVGISDFQSIWPVLEKAVGGKTWDGKENVLDSFVQFVKHTRSFVMNQNGRTEEIAKVRNYQLFEVPHDSSVSQIAFREARRQNQVYRQFSLKSLGDIILLFDSLDVREEVVHIVDPIIEEMRNSSMDLDSGVNEVKDNM